MVEMTMTMTTMTTTLTPTIADARSMVGPQHRPHRGTAPRPPYNTDNDDDGDDHADGDYDHDDDSDDDDNDVDDTDLFCANNHGDEVPPCKPPSRASKRGRGAVKPLLTALYTRCCALYSH